LLAQNYADLEISRRSARYGKATDTRLSHCLSNIKITAILNKSAQSNLGRGPRRGSVADVRRKVPIGYNDAPQIRPQKYPFPWTDPQTPLPASSLDPSDP